MDIDQPAEEEEVRTVIAVFKNGAADSGDENAAAVGPQLSLPVNVTATQLQVGVCGVTGVRTRPRSRDRCRRC